MAEPKNPLLRDRDIDFLLYELLHAEELCALPYFADHGRETFDLYLQSTRRLARDVLFPAYKSMDEEPPRLSDGHVALHPQMKAIYPKLVELGVLAATRPYEVGGQQLPFTVSTLASAYLMAANLAAYGFAGLTTGAAHLLETFGDEAQKRELMTRLYAGEWTGTMALTEPQAGSSLADVKTRATPASDGTYRISGSKIFISGGEHDLTENVVNMTLARIDGAPAGIKGVSLFAVPNKRLEGGALVPNDVHVAGLIHKIGWRGLPSLALSFGDEGDCHGTLVGEPGRGLAAMFQMMNEARIMVGVNGIATASAGYHESLAYARERPQGRPVGTKDPTSPQVLLIEHADVRRMLLRQKAIVEGGLALLATTARFADLAQHAASAEERARSSLLLDLLTPVAKSFPAERGFEANVLSVQIHGGYGYSSEYLPEAWMRDQKLNSIHEGTTGIQGLDLLGRKVMAAGGAALAHLDREIAVTRDRAALAGVPTAWIQAVGAAMEQVKDLTMRLAQRGLAGDAGGMLLHSADYLELFSILVIGWQWLAMAAVAREGLARGEVSREGLSRSDEDDFYQGKLSAAQLWIAAEVPRIEHLASLCASGEDSYARARPEGF